MSVKHGDANKRPTKNAGATGRWYASLNGPLIGFYFPLPYTNDSENRILLNKGPLAKLWCSTYREEVVNELISKHGGIKLEESYALRLI